MRPRAIHRPSLALVLTLGLGILACDEPQSPSSDHLSIEAMQGAIDFVEERLVAAHPLTVDGLPAALAEGLARARASAGTPMAEADFAFVLSEAVGALADGHTYIDWKPEALADIARVELPFVWTTVGLFVSRDTDHLQRGDRIVTVGGVEEAELLDRLAVITPHENRHHVRALAPELLPRVDALRHLGLLDADRVALTIERGGSPLEVTLSPGPFEAPAAERHWVGYEIDRDASIGVFWLDDCTYDAEYAAALDAFMETVVAGGIEHVAVDLSRNPGGDSTVAFAFFEYLARDYASFGVDLRPSSVLFEGYPVFDTPDVRGALEAFGVDLDTPIWQIPGAAIRVSITAGLPPVPDERLFGGEVHIFTSARTFSSASLFATLVRDNATGLLVGEPSGNAVDFHGQGARLPIPGTRLLLSTATSTNRRPDTAHAGETTLTPDIAAPLTGDHLRDGDDPYLTALRAHLERR